MIESPAPPGLEGDTLMSATPKATEEGAAPFDASQDLLAGNAEEKESEGQSSTDGCVRQNKGMNTGHENTENSANSSQSERTVDVATQGDHSGPACVEKAALSPTDGSEQDHTEHRAPTTDSISAEEGEGATILNDDDATGLGDLEDVKESTLQSKGVNHVLSVDTHAYQVILPWHGSPQCCACVQETQMPQMMPRARMGLVALRRLTPGAQRKVLEETMRLK